MLCPAALGIIMVSSCLWCTKASLNSSSVRVFSSFWRKVMSENMVANVRATSIAVLVLFWRQRIAQVHLQLPQQRKPCLCPVRSGTGNWQ